MTPGDMLRVLSKANRIDRFIFPASYSDEDRKAKAQEWAGMVPEVLDYQLGARIVREHYSTAATANTDLRPAHFIEWVRSHPEVVGEPKAHNAMITREGEQFAVWCPCGMDGGPFEDSRAAESVRASHMRGQVRAVTA